MSAAKRLLIVDDDDMLCDSLLEQFSLFGEFAARSSQTATESSSRMDPPVCMIAVTPAHARAPRTSVFVRRRS